MLIKLTCFSTGPYTFTIGDTRGLGQYKRGGWFHQVKLPKLIDFVCQDLQVGS